MTDAIENQVEVSLAKLEEIAIKQFFSVEHVARRTPGKPGRKPHELLRVLVNLMVLAGLRAELADLIVLDVDSRSQAAERLEKYVVVSE